MKIVLRYPLVAGTIAVLLAVVLLLISGQEDIAQIGASIYALAVAAYLAVGMVRRLMGGQWGIDILAVTAIVSTVLVGEFVASMIIVLMMAGGTALEDYAAGRAKGGAAASDAFYPFEDGVEAAAAAGVAAVIQPGGSMRDEKIIERADELGLAMVFTGERHFLH